MAALIGMIRSGEIRPGSLVLYAHLGGQAALSAYADTVGLRASPPRDESASPPPTESGAHMRNY